jgi:transglutaminase-like putative cysteine protease
VKAGGREYDALKFTTRMAKSEVTSWIDDKGMAIVETSPPGIRSERTTADQVLKTEPEGEKLDVLAVFRVPVDTVIPEGAMVNRLKLEITGIDPKEHDLAGPGQQVLSSAPLVVEIKTSDVPTEPVVLPLAAESDDLKPTVSIQCDAPEVKAKLKEAIGAEKDGVAATRKLVSWVFTVVEKQPTASFPNALDVLKTMKGDCNEHAVLLAALARAAGIPTRIAVGLLYMNRAFYYHAWNEVYLGKWIPVDATFGEFPASALHLKLAQGDLSQQAEILGLVGVIGIKVREFSIARAK